jgi:hypothetical protein
VFIHMYLNTSTAAIFVSTYSFRKASVKNRAEAH